MARSPRKTRLRDIAAQANISVPAVSMALADHPRISLQTKRKVLQISEQLGYRSSQRLLDSSASGPSVKRVGFACIHGTLADPLTATTMMHLAGLASRQEIAMETFCVEDISDPAVLTRRLVKFAEGQDGVILTGYVEQPAVDAVGKADVPLVVLGDPLRGTAVDHVSFDFQGAGRYATAHLLKQGYRRVAFVCELMAPGGANSHWHDGYLLAHHDAGLTPDARLTLDLDDANPERVYRQAPARVGEELINLPEPATALVVSNPFIAEALIGALASGDSPLPMVTASLGTPRPVLQYLPQIILSQEILAQYSFNRLLHICRHAHSRPLRTLVPYQTSGF
ncbi:MAG: LacI family DNA-binding transcriptional regulator [Phycisphaeraceae bacterium]